MFEAAWRIMAWGMGIGMTLELLAYFTVPWLLARVAIIPVGKRRRIQLSPKAREALSNELASPGGYREPATRRFDLTRLSMPLRSEMPGVVARFFPARGFATARLPYSFTEKVMSIARIDIVEESGVVELRARCHTLSTLSMAVVVPAAAVAEIATSGMTLAVLETLAIGMLFVAVNGLVSYFFARRRIEHAVDVVSKEIERALLDAGR